MSVRIRTYSWFADARAHAALAAADSWTRAAGTGERCWIVSPSRGVLDGLRAAAPRTLGVSFLEPAGLRRQLANRFGVELAPPARETVRLAFRLAAKRAGLGGLGGLPAEWLGAMEELDAAGWLRAGPMREEFIPAALAPFASHLLDAPEWLPGVDRRLLDRARVSEGGPPLRIVLLGFDASYALRRSLLLAAAHAAIISRGSAEFLVPLPRHGDLETAGAWIDTLEAELGAEPEALPSEFSPFRPRLAARLTGEETGRRAAPPARGEPPALLVGQSGRDETEAIAQWIVRRLHSKDPAVLPVAVLFPARSPASVALGRRLAELDIVHEDRLGARPEPGWAVLMLRAMAGYVRGDERADALLPVLALREERLRGAAAADAKPLHALEAFRALHDKVQDGRARFVATEGFPGSFVQAIGAWEGEIVAGDLRARWDRGVQALLMPAADLAELDAVLTPVWASLERWVAPTERVPGRMFADFLDDALAAAPTSAPGGGTSERGAPVVLASLGEAALPWWGSVVLADALEGSWPSPPTENVLLPETRRMELNLAAAQHPEARMGRLPLGADAARSVEAGVLAAVEETPGGLAFTARLRDDAEPERACRPNEWLLRVLIAGAPAAQGDPKREAEAAVLAAACQAETKAAPLPAPARKRLREVWEGRWDPRRPFDEFFHCYETLRGGVLAGAPADAWTPNDCRTALSRPAETAFRMVFGLRPARRPHEPLRREEAKVLGALVHRWVAEAFRSQAEGADFTVTPERVQGMRARVRELRTEAERGHPAAAEPPLPAWWRWALAAAESHARRAVGLVGEWALENPGAVLLPRSDIGGQVTGPRGGRLRLEGRADFLLRPPTGGLVAVDLRSSGGSFKAKDVAAGERGVEVAALGWMLGSAGGEAWVLHSDRGEWSEPWRAEEHAVGVEGLRERLVRAQSAWVFGQAGEPWAERDGETLPLATVRVSKRVLARKREATEAVAPLLFSAEANGEEEA